MPLPSAVALQLLVPRPGPLGQTLFVTGVVAFALGALLVLGREDPGGGGTHGDGDPPWWPEFERAFRSYESSSRPRRTLVRS